MKRFITKMTQMTMKMTKSFFFQEKEKTADKFDIKVL